VYRLGLFLGSSTPVIAEYALYPLLPPANILQSTRYMKLRARLKVKGSYNMMKKLKILDLLYGFE